MCRVIRGGRHWGFAHARRGQDTSAWNAKQRGVGHIIAAANRLVRVDLGRFDELKRELRAAGCRRASKAARLAMSLRCPHAGELNRKGSVRAIRVPSDNASGNHGIIIAAP